MASVSLPELVQAIASAVIDAQDQIDQHQLALLQRYFDRDDRPRSATMIVPSLSLDEDKDVRINIPWLALMRPNLLSIKEVQVDFEVELTEFQTARAAATGDTKDDINEGKFPEGGIAGNMMVEVGARKGTQGAAVAKVVLKVVGQEPSEGLARMINELVKRIMIIGGKDG